jgi:asparagine synthase (glutamine-hydrolysing)
MGDWLRGPLREWGEDLLSEQALRDTGVLNPPAVRQRWRQHVSGQSDWNYELWDILMLQAWLKSSRQ